MPDSVPPVGENTTTKLKDLLKASVAYLDETKAILDEEYTNDLRTERHDAYAKMMAEAYGLFSALDLADKEVLFSDLALEIRDDELGYIKQILTDADYRRQVLGSHFKEDNEQTP